MSHIIDGVPVPIGERVIALWSERLREETQLFLRSLEPRFFAISARAASSIDGEKDKVIAALQTRLLRDQAAEMLFALLAAAIQSPFGVALWMLEYKNNELNRVVAGFRQGSPILTVDGRRKVSWKEIAATLFAGASSSTDRSISDLQVHWIGFWDRLAHEFLDPLARKEYASIKHGLRVGAGACKIEVQPKIKTPQGVVPNGDPVLLDGGGFGSGFLAAERIGKQGHHYRLVRHHRNWTPQALNIQIQLIAMSIQNVVAWLLLRNGQPGPIAFDLPPVQPDVFAEAWKADLTLLKLSMSSGVGVEDIHCYSEREMREQCETRGSRSDREPAEPATVPDR